MFTLEEAERSRRNIHYTGLELYPLEWQTIEQLGYISNDEQLTTTARQQPAIELFKQLHTSPWEKDVQLTPHFTLRKVETDVNKWVENRERTMSNINDSVTNAESPALNLSFNLIYFDAFAPEKQPEMWSQELFRLLLSASSRVSQAFSPVPKPISRICGVVAEEALSPISMKIC